MKAITNYKYGGPEVLKLEEIDKPMPQENEVLVKIKAAAINPLDWHVMRGTPYFMRLMTGIAKPTKFNILGADVAGTVEQVGDKVRQLKVGDNVFGDIFNFGLGGAAEYVCVNEGGLVRMPENISFEEAAAVPVAALTALNGLRKFGPISSGQKILINGASGGVGTFAVQIAKIYDAHVTGVCSTTNLELVKSIGADEVIDYTNEYLPQSGRKYDLIFDAVGNLSLADYKNLLSEEGRCAVVGFGGVGHMIRAGLLGGKKIKMVDFKANQRDMNELKNLLASGKISSVIDRSYPLEEAAKAMRYLETGRAKGKVIISIDL